MLLFARVVGLTLSAFFECIQTSSLCGVRGPFVVHSIPSPFGCSVVASSFTIAHIVLPLRDSSPRASYFGSSFNPLLFLSPFFKFVVIVSKRVLYSFCSGGAGGGGGGGEFVEYLYDDARITPFCLSVYSCFCFY